LDSQGHYIQVISVEPYQDPSKSTKEMTTFDKQHGVDKYVLDTPWGGPNGGKPSEDVTKQWKKRYIYVILKSYPGLTRRQKIYEEFEQTLGPIDCAIDLLDNRIELIKLELQLRPPNTKTLQIVLQGSIMLHVNVGPKAIMQAFLGSNQEDTDPKKISILRDKLTEFIRKCEFALKLNSKLITDDQREYQKALEEHFHEFKKEARRFIEL